jgi:hypothetical protein
MLYGWIDDAQEKPPLFLGVDRDGAAIYLHSVNMESWKQRPITKLAPSSNPQQSVKGKTKAEKSRVHS